MLLKDIERLESGDEPAASWHITFRPQADALHRGVRIESLLAELAELGPCRVVADTAELPGLESLNPTSLYLSWTVELTTAARGRRGQGGVPVRRGLFRPVAEPSRPGRAAEAPAAPIEEAVPAAPAPSFEREAKQEAATIRVRKEKLDNLIDLVGELVILQAIFDLEAKKEPTGVFAAISENLARLAADLRDTTMSIRMVPLEESFSTFQRLVRDLALQVNKELRLGAGGRRHRTGQEPGRGLEGPLGPHHPATRPITASRPPRSASGLGKPRAGTIAVEARQVGSRVEITVADDGAGLNLEKIKARAVERKLLDAAESDPQRIQNVIFEPGFSTAEKTTGISGRGVGMDVVKRNIERLRGEVTIQSEAGRGMRITLSIPLTLVIVEGLVVRVGHSDYVVTLSQVQECVDLTPDIQVGTGRDSVINLRGKTFPVVSLRDCLGIQGGEASGPARLVIVQERRRHRRAQGRCRGGPDAGGDQTAFAFGEADQGSFGSHDLGGRVGGLILDVAEIIKAQEQRNEHGNSRKNFRGPAPRGLSRRAGGGASASPT